MIRKCRNPVLIDPQNESCGEKPCGTQIEDDAIGCDECLPPLTVAEKGAMPDTNPMAYSLPTGGLVGKYTRTNVSTLACLDLTDAWMLNRRKLLPEGVALDKLERVETIGIERAKSFVAEFSIREDEESFLLVADIDGDAEALGRKGITAKCA